MKLEKRHIYTLVAVLVLAVTSLVYAYNSGGPPSSMGHSAEEVEVNLPGAGGDVNLQTAITNLQTQINNVGSGVTCSWVNFGGEYVLYSNLQSGYTGACEFDKNGKKYVGVVGNRDTSFDSSGSTNPMLYCYSSDVTSSRNGGTNVKYYACS